MHDFVKRFVEARPITLLNSSILQVPSAYLLLSSHTNPAKAHLTQVFSGSSVPSGFVLWVMREMPPRLVADSHIPARPTVVNFISERTTQNPQWRATVTSSQNKVHSKSYGPFLFILFVFAFTFDLNFSLI